MTDRDDRRDSRTSQQRSRGGRRGRRDRDRPPRGSRPRGDERGPIRNRNMPDMMRRMFMGSTAEVSIFVRTRNGEDYLEELLALLREQDASYETEVIAVDADSTDRTPIILRSRGIRTLHAPPGTDFADQALRAAEGDYLVFLTQDTVPLNARWLDRLVAPLRRQTADLVHGRLIADAGIPPYPRGLITARPYISGKERLDYVKGSDVPGAAWMPPTNMAISRAALKMLGNRLHPGPDQFDRAYRDGFHRRYLPDAVAVLKGTHSLDRFLVEQGTDPGPDRFLKGVWCEAGALWRELYALSEEGDLPSGQRGEAYATAIALHAARAARIAEKRSIVVRRVSQTLSRLF